MTDDTTTSEALDVDFDDAFDAWLEGGHVARRSVVIYSKPHLYAEFQDLERRMRGLVAALGKDVSQSDPEMEALEADYERVYEQWMASKSTWYVHQLSPEDTKLVTASIPVLEALPKDASDAAKATRARKVEAEQNELNLRTVAVATLQLKIGDKVIDLPPISKVDEDDPATMKKALKDVERIVSKLRGMVRTIGDDGVLKIIEAIALAGRDDEIPAPKSRKPSESDQG